MSNEFIEKNQPDFAFENKIGVHELLCGNAHELAKMIERLIICMKETNEIHKVKCEFFRLDFRQPYFDEAKQFPYCYLILDMKWGSKKELKNKNESITK